MTTNFYAPPDAFREGYVTLPPGEAQHAVKVLRAAPGQTLVIVDGEGGWHEVEVDMASHDHLAGRVLRTRRNVGEPTYELTLAVGLLKQRSRWETLIEKATELGVRAIVPLTTAQGEKARMRRDRCEKLLLAAMKQTRRSWLPTLHDPTPVDEALQTHADGTGLIATMDAPETAHPIAVLQDVQPGPVAAFIGPEGGFSPEERAQARDLGYRPVSLGERRLRTETAGITLAAACALHFA